MGQIDRALELQTKLVDAEAERAVVGECLMDRANLVIARERLVPDDFYDHSRRQIFRAIVEILDRDNAVDVVAVHSWLKDHGFAPAATNSLGAIIAEPHSFWNFESHVERIKRLSAARQLFTMHRELEALLLDGADVVDVIGQALDRESKLLTAVDKPQEERLGAIAIGMTDELEERYKQRGSLPGITSGISKLDRITCGWGPRLPYIIIAARPSVGKTTFALNLAVAAGQAGYQVRIFSMEMDRQSLAEMFLSLLGGVENMRLRTGALSDDDFSRVSSAIGIMADMGICIDDTPELSVSQIRARIQRQMLERGCDLVIIDYLQLIKGTGRYRNKYEEVTEISRQLKAACRALRIPIIILCQLSRDVEKRGGKTPAKPRMSDLRESGAIEQDADIICMLYDPQANEDDEIRPDSGPINLRVVKNRRGLIGTVNLWYDRNFCQFRQGVKQDG